MNFRAGLALPAGAAIAPLGRVMRIIIAKLRGAWTRCFRFVPLAILVLSGALLASFLAGCPPQNTVTYQEPKPTASPAPLVRVKLSVAPTGAQVATTGAYRLRCGGRVVSESRSPLGWRTVSNAGGLWRVGSSAWRGNDLWIEPAGNTRIYVNAVCYRGKIRFLPQSDGIAVVNHVDLESYLAGVLCKELIPSWHLETYKALAIAARTFAIYNRQEKAAAHDWDLLDNEGSQVYGGYTAEITVPNSRRAVDATRGQVLAYRQGGKMQIFLSQYSACCGGTVNGAYVIRNAPPEGPIRGGQSCNDCTACTRYRWGDARLPKSELYRALLARYGQTASLGNVSAVNVASTTPYGRAVFIDVIGTTGQSMRIRAEDLRLAWNMSPYGQSQRVYSMNCTIRTSGSTIDLLDGRGFGHGVGLCQWGAQGKALKGWKHRQILSAYYPGASIIHGY